MDDCARRRRHARQRRDHRPAPGGGDRQLLAGMLYQVGALDPIAFLAAPLVLGAATLLATWLPARRATRISPMAALRTE